MNNDLHTFKEQMLKLRLPRWDELPDLGLYSDQVLSFVESCLNFADIEYNSTIITKSMINNYAKLGLMPRPIKKKYYREHIGYLIIITLLKQILSITEIKTGIELQVQRSTYESAYNLFCDEMEDSIRLIFTRLNSDDPNELIIHDFTPDNTGVKLVAISFAAQLLTKKIIQFHGVENFEGNTSP